jgi:hypothetical protein
MDTFDGELSRIADRIGQPGFAPTTCNELRNRDTSGEPAKAGPAWRALSELVNAALTRRDQPPSREAATNSGNINLRNFAGRALAKLRPCPFFAATPRHIRDRDGRRPKDTRKNVSSALTSQLPDCHKQK